MPISIACPGCQAKYRVPDTAAGKSVKCQKCGQSIPIPAAVAPPTPIEDEPAVAVTARTPAPAAPASDFESFDDGDAEPAPRKKKARRGRDDDDDRGRERDEDDAPPRPAKKSNGTKILLIVLGVLFGLFVICGGSVAFVFYRISSAAVGVAKEIEIAAKKAHEDAIRNQQNNGGGGINMPNNPGDNAPAAGTVVLQKKDTLSKADVKDMGKAYKEYSIQLEQGKQYQIDMQSQQMDSYLYLHGINNELLMQDDDGGGFPHARITFTPPQTGMYRIRASILGGFPFVPASFDLTVRKLGA